jgi:hypothetical protein
VIFGRVRRSRKTRWCENTYAHKRRISPGDLYEVVSVTPKDGDIGAGKWYQFPVCSACARPTAILEYFTRDKQGIALVAAIHQRKEASP